VATQRDLSRADLVELAREVGSRLGKDTVARSEFLRETGLTEWQVMKHFNTWNELVEAAGLTVFPNRRLTDDELFTALRDGYIAAGGVVSRTRLRKVCRVSDSVYAHRFGRWPNVLAQFRGWLIENDPDFPYLTELPRDGIGPARRRSEGAGAARGVTPAAGDSTAARTKYGPFLNFRGLQHAPINEQGVVFLFGIVAFDLGYVVEGIGSGYPDCEAKRSIGRDGDVWERVRIEFEYKSRHFRDHGHDPTSCDVVVCWEHNWPDCPVEVLELRAAIEALEED
jgi:hypothetical protein